MQIGNYYTLRCTNYKLDYKISFTFQFYNYYMEVKQSSQNQILCEKHNDKAYFLCIQEKCTLPILICNQCIQDNHAHISVPIKKIKNLTHQRSEKHEETDEITNKIKSSYQDFKESILKAIEEDQKLFIDEVCTKKKPEMSKQVESALQKIKSNDFKELNSTIIKQVMVILETKDPEESLLQEIITKQLNSRKFFFDSIKNQLKCVVSINNRWQFVTTESKKVRKGDSYILQQGMNLVGNQILNSQIHKWKITFKKFDNFSCLGFGIGNLKQLDRMDVSKNSIICCICCNGPWSGKAVDTFQHCNLKSLLSQFSDFIILQVNRTQNLFLIYGPDGKIFGKKELSYLGVLPNIVPIAKNAANYGVQFTLETLL